MFLTDFTEGLIFGPEACAEQTTIEHFKNRAWVGNRGLGKRNDGSGRETDVVDTPFLIQRLQLNFEEQWCIKYPNKTIEAEHV